MKNKIAVLGVAPCLEEDLENLFKLSRFREFDFMGIGLDFSDRVLFYVKHVATYHVKEFDEFKERRQRAGGNTDYETHSHIAPANHIWPLVESSPYSGSSSFLGAQAAVGLGYEKIVLCGCPMSGPNTNPAKKESYDSFQCGWTKYAPSVLGDKVRSMSGFTRDLLNYPNKEWLNE